MIIGVTMALAGAALLILAIAMTWVLCWANKALASKAI